MKNLVLFILIAFIVIFTGCAGRSVHPNSELDALRKQLAAQQEEIARLKQVAADGYQPPRMGGLPSDAPVPPNLGAQASMNGGGVPAAAILVSSLPPSFPGVYGTEPRQRTMGPYLKLENRVCDGGYDMGVNCRDADGNGGPDYNYAVAYWIEGKPAGCGNGFQRYSDGPCWVEIGTLRKFKLTVRRYRLSGNQRNPKINPTEDQGAFDIVIDTYGQNVTPYQVSENPFR